MRRILLPLLFIALLGQACATTPASAPATAPAPRERAFLWEVKDAKGQGTAYLVGSVHIGREGEFVFPPSMEAAFARSDTLVVEVDVTKLDTAKIQQTVFQNGLLPPGQTLSARLDPETRTLLGPAVERVGLPMLGIERMRPWLVAMTLMGLEMQRSGFEGSHGVDQMLLDRAHASQGAASTEGTRGPKQIIELETAEGQLMVLANLPDEVQDLMLREQLQRSESSSEYFDSIRAAWKAGDGEAMAALLLKMNENPQYRPVYEKLFVERNVQMARRVTELLAEPRTHFVVVGAGHVVGPEGLVALLEKQGYSVRQLGLTAP